MKPLRNAKLRRPATINHARWLAYATAGAATMIGGAESAEATIHYSGVINHTFNAPPNGSSFQTFTLDQAGDFFRIGQAVLNSAGTDGFAGFGMGGIVSGKFVGYTSGGGAYALASRLVAGQAFSMATNFVNNGTVFGTGTLAGGSVYGQFRTAGPGYIGFRFNSGSGMQFGWAHVQMNGAGAANSFTLIDYAYGDVGDSIVAGEVPEPGSLGLLALGGIGLLAWRKRRRKAT
jgi:hypothetical protein